MSNIEQQERTVALGFYASALMAERLKEAARQQDGSVSAAIRQALEVELQREVEGVVVSVWKLVVSHAAQEDSSNVRLGCGRRKRRSRFRTLRNQCDPPG